MRNQASMILVCALWTAPATAAEWWQGDFAWAESTHVCEDNDSRASYAETEASFWEQSCKYKKVTLLKGMDAVILDMTCSGEGEDLGSKRELLINMGEGKIATFAPFHILKPCSEFGVTPPTPTPTPVPEPNSCPSNSRLYRSALNGNNDPNSYQEIQFIDGLTSGTVNLTEYQAGKAVWAAHGEYGCSNGASICSVSFPLMLGETGDIPYEVVDYDSATRETVVVPALRQMVYMQQNNVNAESKPYTGLVADLLGGFAPSKDNNFIGPYNIYRIAGCKP